MDFVLRLKRDKEIHLDIRRQEQYSIKKSMTQERREKNNIALEVQKDHLCQIACDFPKGASS